MSEYQYHEFAAVDRPLTPAELDAIRALSSPANLTRLTPTSFVDTYEWGGSEVDPRSLVEQYFDAFLRQANAGLRELVLRFPAHLLELDTVRRYCPASTWPAGDHVIAAAVSDLAAGDLTWGGEGVLPSILPVRAEVLAGDRRALYLLWLLGVQSGEIAGDEVEPAVPAALDDLSEAQTALAAFLRIDGDLVAVAAAPADDAVDLAAWVAGLAPAERDALLVGFLRGADPALRAKALRNAGSGHASCTRTAADLLDRARQRREQRERAEHDRRATAAAEQARQVHADRLAALTAEGDAAWGRVAASIAQKKPASYDAAVALLVELREVTNTAAFRARLWKMRREHGRKVGLVQRLDHAGL